MPKFKKKSQAPNGANTQAASPDAEPLLAHACRSFISGLVSVSTGQHSIVEVRSSLDQVAKDLATLDLDDRAELLNEVDTFIGRVRAHVEPLLEEWGAANRSALAKKLAE